MFVPLLRYCDPLPWPPRRVLVAGSSGSGKTTLALLVARAWEMPYVELDSLFHGPGWVPRPAFQADVEQFAAQPRWVTEWQYTDVLGPLLGERADLVLWLDLPRRSVMSQLVRRTVIRRLRDEQLWNGNKEPRLRTVLTDPEHLVRWAWRNHGRAGIRVADVLSRRGDDVAVVRLGARRELKVWVHRNLS